MSLADEVEALCPKQHVAFITPYICKCVGGKVWKWPGHDLVRRVREMETDLSNYQAWRPRGTKP